MSRKIYAQYHTYDYVIPKIRQRHNYFVLALKFLYNICHFKLSWLLSQRLFFIAKSVLWWKLVIGVALYSSGVVKREAAASAISKGLKMSLIPFFGVHIYWVLILWNAK